MLFFAIVLHHLISRRSVSAGLWASSLLLALGCSSETPLTIRPTPPGVEYAWRSSSSSPDRIGRSAAIHRASSRVEEGVVLGERLAVIELRARRIASSEAGSDLASSRGTSGRGASAASVLLQVNPNTATTAELERLPGIGPTLAERIIAGRPYRRHDDLLRVSGIGQVTLERLRSYITLDESANEP